ncbi:MAG: hypothetical protein DRN91_07350 [Candidatus Alkanophagales archaeon]|nr:MAG: hypothetical protein DRN91_07350 [Candidatus Alkanophagales archaeon]
MTKSSQELSEESGSGLACYVHICENAARTLAHAGVKNVKALKDVCDAVGVETDANKLVGFVLADVYRKRWEPSEIGLRLAPKKRLAVYEKLGIVPGGAMVEIVDALVKCSFML